MRINRITGGARVTVLAKIEGRSPAYSVKDRIGAGMVWDAEKRGILKPGKEIVEATSGNTWIALAYVAAARGYAITLTMPETMSIERRKVAQALGAELLLTEGAQGMAGSIARALELVSPARRYGRIPGAPSTCWWPAWARAALLRASRATSKRSRARRSAQNSGHRRRLHSGYAGPWYGGPYGAGHR